MRIASLDIGGANIKACVGEFGRGGRARGYSVYHPVYRDLDGLEEKLAVLRDSMSEQCRIDCVALTMTAELCDIFSSKEQGVCNILSIVQKVFAQPLYVWTVERRFARPEEIYAEPLKAAAANWLASACAAAQCTPGNAFWADMGSTTTDLLLLSGGSVLTNSRTDLDRLITGELIYAGVLRTSVDTLVDRVKVRITQTGEDSSQSAEAWKLCGIAHEYFACTADLYRYLGFLSEADYSIPTPDGRGKSAHECEKRLARVVAADPMDLGKHGVHFLAEQLFAAQLQLIEKALSHLRCQEEAQNTNRLIVAGQGCFILERAAANLGMAALSWWDVIEGGDRSIPATVFSMAWLLNKALE